MNTFDGKSVWHRDIPIKIITDNFEMLDQNYIDDQITNINTIIDYLDKSIIGQRNKDKFITIEFYIVIRSMMITIWKPNQECIFECKNIEDLDKFIILNYPNLLIVN